MIALAFKSHDLSLIPQTHMEEGNGSHKLSLTSTYKPYHMHTLHIHSK